MGLSLNSVCYIFSFGLTGLAIGYLYLKNKHDRMRRDNAQNNHEFRGLQRLFIPPYLIVLLAESLQAPFLYVLYHSYRFIPSQIAALHSTGLFACMVVSSLSNRLIRKYGTRSLCLLCTSTAGVACLLKFSSSFLLLFVSRLLDGISAALVTAAFQEWYAERHITRMDFPPEWIEATFAKVASGAALGAVLAGWIAQMVEGSTGVIGMPFAFSALLMVTAGFLIGSRWDGGKPAAVDAPATLSFGKELSILLRQPVALVLSVITVFCESALQIFIFAWSPILLKSKAIEGENLGFGAAYACLMAFALVGALFFHSPPARGIPASRTLAGALMGSVLALFLTYKHLPESSLHWKTANFQWLLLTFCAFEATVGLLSPALAKLKAELTPSLGRGSLTNIPVTVIASAAIILLHPMGDAQRSLVITALCLLIMATFLAILLDLVLASRGGDTQRPLSLSQPRPVASHPTVHQTPSQG